MTVLTIGSTAQLQLNVFVANADGYAIGSSLATDAVPSWVSSNPSVATVDQAGLVTGIGEGQATITARSTVGSAPVGSSWQFTVRRVQNGFAAEVALVSQTTASPPVYAPAPVPVSAPPAPPLSGS